MSSAPGSPRPPDQSPRADRERIDEALLDLCFEHGYRGTSLPMLLDRAGVDEVEFHRYYDDLEDCICSVYQRTRDELMERIAAAIAAETTWRDGLRAAIYVMVDSFEEDEKRTRLMAVEVQTAGDRAVNLIQEGYERFFDFLDLGREARNDSGSISRATAEAIGGAIFLQMYSSYKYGSVDSVRGEVPKIMYTAVLPYLGPEAAEEELRRRHNGGGDERGRTTQRPG